LSSSNENIQTMMEAISERLNVVNKGLFDHEDFNTDCLDDLRDVHKMIMMKQTFSISEREAILDELRKMRKK
jgi:uncharacterized protein YfkK (UPF0435 family)